MRVARTFALLVVVGLAASSLASASVATSDVPRGASASRLLVRFTASDGFTFSNALDVRRDGTAVLRCSSHFGPGFRLIAARASFRLTPRRLRSLRQLLDEAHFDTLDDEYLPERRGADLPSYSITYRGKRVYVDGFAIGEGKVPRPLLRAIALLNRIVEPEAKKALERAGG